MRIFSDLHHYCLYNSLQMLFEKRLSHELYRPIGMDWFTSGYWKIAAPYGDCPETVRQFLEINDLPWDAENINGGNYEKDGIYHIWDPIHEVYQKAITYQKFLEMDWDVVISSIPAHDVSFAALIRDHKPKAKHIAQMGNIYQQTDVPNVLCSTLPYPVPADKNVVFYHQEFDLDVFKYTLPSGNAKITSFVNLLPDEPTYYALKNEMPEVDFKAYGISCPDGTITGVKNIAEIMSKSAFGLHIKPQGDGFGHIIHNWFACGRPVITRFSDYSDKLAGALLIDGVTALNIESAFGLGFPERVREILNDPDRHLQMCLAARERFDELVNFGEEAAKVAAFLERLI